MQLIYFLSDCCFNSEGQTSGLKENFKIPLAVSDQPSNQMWFFSPVTGSGGAAVKHLHRNTKRKCYDVIELKLSIQNQTNVCIDLPSCSGTFFFFFHILQKCAKCLETGLEITTE